jgi:hypothetical protein
VNKVDERHKVSAGHPSDINWMIGEGNGQSVYGKPPADSAFPLEFYLTTGLLQEHALRRALHAFSCVLAALTFRFGCVQYIHRLGDQ